MSNNLLTRKKMLDLTCPVAGCYEQGIEDVGYIK
jgi:hypothetical protein